MSDTHTIKDRLDIVQLIGEYVTLKKSGINWKANCPFHNEKSPSFMVHREKQIWRCFGCGKNGDIFTFIQEIEGLDFLESLKLLAVRAGVEITTHRNEMNQSQRNRLVEINSAAAYFFHQFLLEMPAAESARAYLTQRKLTASTIQTWQVGYVAEQWDLLTRYLLKKGFGIDDLVMSGITIKREGANSLSGQGYYDRFRGRIMFPICDAHGNVFGFTGRVLVESEHSGGKYVNTPQTPLYDKSRLLYGLHLGKASIKAKNSVVLVEGQMDVIACHQAGMTNVVAASGTALTNEQVKIIKRYTDTIIMAFDADLAGQNAGERGVALAVEQGLKVKVIQLPPGFAKDADECLKKDPAVWFRAVESAAGIMEWYFAKTIPGLNLNDPEQKQRAADILLRQIAIIPAAVVRDEWLKRCSEELSISLSILREQAHQIIRSTPLRPKATADTLSTRSKVTVDNAPFSTNNIFDSSKTPRPVLELLAQEWWSLIIKYPELYAGATVFVKPAYFGFGKLADLYEMSQNLYTVNKELRLEELRKAAAVDGTENIVDVLLLRPYKNDDELTPDKAAKELQSIHDRLVEEWKKERRSILQMAISKAERENDAATVEKLFTELRQL